MQLGGSEADLASWAYKPGPSLWGEIHLGLGPVEAWSCSETRTLIARAGRMMNASEPSSGVGCWASARLLISGSGDPEGLGWLVTLEIVRLESWPWLSPGFASN